jgi:hypothetical protein
MASLEGFIQNVHANFATRLKLGGQPVDVRHSAGLGAQGVGFASTDQR